MNRKDSLSLQERQKDFRHICIYLDTQRKPEEQDSGVLGTGSRTEISWLNPTQALLLGPRSKELELLLVPVSLPGKWS